MRPVQGAARCPPPRTVARTGESPRRWARSAWPSPSAPAAAERTRAARRRRAPLPTPPRRRPRRRPRRPPPPPTYASWRAGACPPRSSSRRWPRRAAGRVLADRRPGRRPTPRSPTSCGSRRARRGSSATCAAAAHDIGAATLQRAQAYTFGGGTAAGPIATISAVSAARRRRGRRPPARRRCRTPPRRRSARRPTSSAATRRRRRCARCWPSARAGRSATSPRCPMPLRYAAVAAVGARVC